MTPNDEEVIEACIAAGLLTRPQVECLRQQKPEANLLSILLKTRLLTQEKATQALAAYHGMEYVVLSSTSISPEILRVLPRHIVLHYRVLPFQKHNDQFVMAISDPGNLPAMDSIRALFHNPVEFVCVAPDQLDQALLRHYGNAEEAPVNPSPKSEANRTQYRIQDERKHDDTPVITMVSNLILEAYERRASDIHLEPMGSRLRIRFRIDGILQEVQSLPSTLQGTMMSRLKIMSGSMNIAEKRIPQDGRIQFRIKAQSLDLRVATLPTIHGESAVIRILDKSSLILSLSNLGFSGNDQATFENLITAPHGMILITGPTGSGKTTTLYACLHSINKSDQKLITVEDPIEYQIPGINQVQINVAIGLTFPAALRSILRQAPNILMIGEIRDYETASIAMHASLTGHLVFSTLHTNDAPGAIARLVDIGIPPFLISSSVRAVIAQRLVRRLCPHCKKPTKLSEHERNLLHLKSYTIPGAQLMAPVGCNACRSKGYKGRMGIFEIFVLDDGLRHLINHSAPPVELRFHACKKSGMQSLAQDGARKVLAGLTTPQEVIANITELL